MEKDAARTVHAQQAMEITDLFSYKFGALRFGQQEPRRLKLLEPDGPSTAGGKQARQSMVLQTEGAQPQTLVLGWVDTAVRKSEVKTLAALQALNQQRYQSPLDLEVAEYERLVSELRGFLKIQKIDLDEVEGAPIRPRATSQARVPVAPAPTSGNQTGTLVAVFGAGVAVGLLLGYLVFAS